MFGGFRFQVSEFQVPRVGVTAVLLVGAGVFHVSCIQFQVTRSRPPSLGKGGGVYSGSLGLDRGVYSGPIGLDWGSGGGSLGLDRGAGGMTECQQKGGYGDTVRSL